MAEVEKYIAKRINKDVSPGGVQADGTRMMLPGELTDALNCRIDIDGVVRNIQGNVLSTYPDLGAGNNTVIGSFPYRKYNTIIAFIYNDMGNHRVFEWNPSTGVFVTLLQGSSLNFNVNHHVNSGGVLDDLLIWNDAFNLIRFININDAKNGLYVPPYSKYRLSLATQPPLVAPTITIETDPTILVNNIAKSTFQFAYNFLYTDNRESAYSPLSKLAWVRPYNEPDDPSKNVIAVGIEVPVELYGIIKQVNIVYREGNTGLYYTFATIKNPTGLGPYHTVRFNNNGKAMSVSDEDQTLLSDAIPTVSKSVELMRNRLFCVLNKSGYDIDESTFTFGALVSDIWTAEVPDFEDGYRSDYPNHRYFKNGGTYTVGVVFYDDFGKMSFVKSAKEVHIPFGYLGKAENKVRLICGISGTPPPGFTKYQFVISPDHFYAAYFQCVPVIHLYLREKVEGEEDNTQDDTHYIWKGRKFLKLDKIATHGGPVPYLLGKGYKYIYLQVPTNIPFVPDTDCLIRFKEGWGGAEGRRFCNIVAVDGEFLVIDLITWSPNLTGSWEPIDWRQYGYEIEVFKPATSFDEIFYEVGQIGNIVNGAFGPPVGYDPDFGLLDGDTYNLRFSTQGRYNMSSTSVIADGSYGPIPKQNFTIVLSPVTYDQYVQQSVVESPSGIFASTIVTATLKVPFQFTKNRNKLQRMFGVSSQVETRPLEITERKNVYSLDYEKQAADYGRANIVLDEAREKDYYNVISYSSPYLENSFINGLNRFFPADQYQLPIDRGPVIALKKAGTVLLAIHERTTTTLYIGEAFIKQGEDFVLTKTDAVIGDDREMQGGYGTINPESVIEVNGAAYWWDAYRGAVVRYTNAGLFAVSDYGMFNYFIAKGRELLPYRDIAKVVTAHDYLNNELVVTFCDVINDAGVMLVPGVTWAFNTKRNEWRSRYSFVPERYCSTETDLVSFKIGRLWHHHKNTLFNNFYGEQFARMWKFISNPRLGKNKRWLNVHIKGAVATNHATSELEAVRITTKEGQRSVIPAYEFQMEEGKFVAPVLKDMNTVVEDGQLPLRSGDDMVSEYAEIEVNNDRVDAAEVSQVNVVYKDEEFSI